MLRDRDLDRNAATGDFGTGLDERVYALIGPDGSVVAVTDVAGAVLERYVYDALGSAQVLDPDGSSRTFWETENWGDDAFGEYYVTPPADFLGSNTQLGGTHLAWRHYAGGQFYDRVPGLYRSASGGGVVSPRQDRALTPDLAAYGLGRGAYTMEGSVP